MLRSYGPILIVTTLATVSIGIHVASDPVQASTAADTAFDAAPFGFEINDPGESAYGIRWAEPRQVRRVVLEFAPDAAIPAPDSVKIQYWHRIWDGKPDPVLSEINAGKVGWNKMDDWTNGEWKDADTQLQVDGKQWSFTFNPTGDKEFEDLGHPGVTYRKTLKIRAIASDKMPRPARLQAMTDSEYRPLTVRIHFGQPAEPSIRIAGAESFRFEVFNGKFVNVRPIKGVGPASKRSSQLVLPANAEGILEVDLMMAVNPHPSAGVGNDRTVVTVRSQYRPFSFAPEEAARGDRILIDDLGVLVVTGDDAITLEQYREARKEFSGRTVYDRVFDEPEQTLQRSWNEMPLKRPLEFVHGLPGNRNAYHQHAEGIIDIAGKSKWFEKFPSEKDEARKLWKGHTYHLQFDFAPDDLRGGRELKDGYLPQLRTWWQDGPIYYEQTTILDKIDGNLSTIRLDDPTALLMRARVVNTSADEPGTATLSINGSDPDREKLYCQGDRILADFEGKPRLRALCNTAGRGQLLDDGDGVLWSLDLKPGDSHNFYLTVPSITLSGEDEIEPLRQRNFDADSKRICDYWRAITARGTQITTPEPWLNDFYKAHVRHMLVNCYKELDSDLLHAHVGTLRYGVYPNESCMMISDLDRRGYHKEARQNLEAYLHYQGSKMFLGDYQSKEGVFYGAGKHETGNYNKSHGYVCWNMAEHWKNTRDREWMTKAAPKLVKACEWIIRERQATRKTNADGTRPIEYGFLPAGSLEDITDFWYWLATNSAMVWGFDALADALADFGHPEAPRLQREAKAYHDDVMRGFTESRVRTPVVRLRDATYVPKYPSRLYERGRCHGWLRETLEGALFLPIYGLIGPDEVESKWILKDYEDNLYISQRYGYAIPAFDNFWFSRGGFSMQSNLLDGPLPYLYRDEIKHYVRTYFNSFTAAYYPEIRMCNEHSLPELGFPIGDHFKSSDEAQSTYWLRLMYVCEHGDDLHLGRAIPRYWLDQGNTIGIERSASYFGSLSWQMTSDIEAGKIKALLTPPKRNPPKTIYVRFRHPQQKPILSVTVNGKPYDRFDVEKEWVILPGNIEGSVEIIVTYKPVKSKGKKIKRFRWTHG